MIQWIKRHPMGSAWTVLAVLIALGIYLQSNTLDVAQQQAEDSAERGRRQAETNETLLNRTNTLLANTNDLLDKIDTSIKKGRRESRSQTATLIAYLECIAILGPNPTIDELEECARVGAQAGRESRNGNSEGGGDGNGGNNGNNKNGKGNGKGNGGNGNGDPDPDPTPDPEPSVCILEVCVDPPPSLPPLPRLFEMFRSLFV